MRGRSIAVNVALESITRLELPPNCEVLARSYVGDIEHALVRAPKNRALFLIAPESVWRLDVGQLVAGFADNLRALDRQRELELGIEWPRRLRLAKLPRARKRA